MQALEPPERAATTTGQGRHRSSYIVKDKILGNESGKFGPRNY